MPHQKAKQTAKENIDWSRKKIRFSFEYYDEGHPEYCLSNWGKEQIVLTFKRLKDINSKNLLELQTQQPYRFHEVDWSKTIYKKGFTNPTVNCLSPFQFALVGVNGRLARVFGAFAEGIFYLVWFDLKHKIWPVTLKRT